MFISMKFRNSLKIVVLSVSFCIAAIVPTFAATQDVRVTNFPTSYSVVNTTWDSRLSTLQTTLQALAADMSQFPTFTSRFGWNGTMSFSQGFELLYNDVHSLATATSQSDIFTAFNREFPLANFDTGSSSKFYLRESVSRLGGMAQSLSALNTKANNIDTTTQHIDSDLHSIGSTVSAINFDTTTIKNLVNSNLPYIKVNTDNISFDTDSIDRKTTTLVSISGSILEDANYIMDDTFTLRNFFADNDTIDQKAGAKDASDQAINTFTGAGSSAASADTYSDINDFSSGVTDSFQTGVAGSQAISYLSNGRDVMGWFSVDTYNAFHSGESSSNSNSRFMRSQSSYPLLEQYYSDVFSVVCVE